MKDKPTKPKGSKREKKKPSAALPVVKKSVSNPKVRKKRTTNPADYIFIEDEAQGFFESLNVIRGILRQQKADRLVETNYAPSSFPSIAQIKQRLVSVFMDIEDLPVRAFSKEFGWFFQATALWVFQTLPIHEDIFKDVGDRKVFDKICALFKREWDRRTKSPDRRSAAAREAYQRECKNAIFETIILHEAGIRKHWLRPTLMPEERWGSPSGKANWHLWIRNLLSDMHKSGELFRYNDDTPAKNNFAGSRAKSRDRFFLEVYNISLNFMQPVFQSTARMLYSRYTQQPCPEPFNVYIFIDLLCKMHPEIVPQRPPAQTA